MLPLPADRQVYVAILGQVIRQLRAARQMSQEKLAGAASLSKSALSRFELGQSVPDVEEGRRIAIALSTSLPELAKLAEAAVSRATAIRQDGQGERTSDIAQAGLAMMAVAEVTKAADDVHGKRPRRQYWRGRTVAGR